MLALVLQCLRSSDSLPSIGLRLTLRSTGPIAACRHLGYKSLAQIPAHRNGPVNLNVRRRLFQGLRASKTPSSRTTFALHCRYSWRSSNQALKTNFFVLHRLPRYCLYSIKPNRPRPSKPPPSLFSCWLSFRNACCPQIPCLRSGYA